MNHLCGVHFGMTSFLRFDCLLDLMINHIPYITDYDKICCRFSVQFEAFYMVLLHFSRLAIGIG